MRIRDFDRERSEQPRSLADFLKVYNENLSHAFPRASIILLKEFESTHGNLFKQNGEWSLDLHRKKVMDWLRPRSVK